MRIRILIRSNHPPDEEPKKADSNHRTNHTTIVHTSTFAPLMITAIDTILISNDSMRSCIRTQLYSCLGV